MNMNFSELKQNKKNRLKRVQNFLEGKYVQKENIVKLLENLIEPMDTVCIEGNNQKQAEFLAKSFVQVDPEKVNHIHIIQSSLILSEHIEIFEKGIANKLDFSYASIFGSRLLELAQQGKVTIQGMHTFLELYSRYFLDLTPRVALIVAEKADKEGNLYTGANTEDTPVIVEATAFRNGIVIAEVNEIVDKLPRIDIPSDWVDVVVLSPNKPLINPLFTRDPAKINETKILMAMMIIKGIYAKYGVNRLNHGVGYCTSAVELLLPTYAESLGLKGKICQYMAMNPIPTLIPAIESGFIKKVCVYGGETGMDIYAKSRPDIFSTGRDGTLRSNRCYSQMVGLYGIDLFAGATLQMDIFGNSTTATLGRITGFGGAPNIGGNSSGRRHATQSWLMAGNENKKNENDILRGKKLVVQAVETFQPSGAPSFVEELDAWKLQEQLNMPLPPIMIYGEDVTHIVTEEGMANLLLCRTAEDREQAIRCIAGKTSVGLKRDLNKLNELREKRIVTYPEDIGIHKSEASRDLLSAKSIQDLVECSQGLYQPPAKFLR
ncbi:malonate decarboxylase subunit alpha [Silvanigrella aquatica]|uniref:Malonate decarboxylase subunit alpha n=1 Tax=Silvanigrella aquatica TaxID=1915309 RepID=A0A1L4D4S1_9BACT|nr:malonate decarboxylase subunit alpha [Silvanigrella aquatica]